MSITEPLLQVPAIMTPQIIRQDCSEGGFVLSAAQPLEPHAPAMGQWLARWARERPDGVVLAERRGDGWRELTWRQAYQQARAIGQALLDRGLSLDRPVAILSGNSIDHAQLMFGALLAGVPVVPVSVAYSLMSAAHAQLRHVIELVTPGMVFVEQGQPFVAALSKLELDGVELVSDHPPEGLAATPLAELLACEPTEALDRASASIGADTVAKILMTSGSTARPKGVINTHGMLTANQQALAQAWSFVRQAPPVLVDWLPWSHTFGGNHNLNLVLNTGGTMYIDGGRPAPGRFEETVRNLSEIAPTIQFNVPAGYAMLAQALQDNAALREKFFSRIEAIFYAAAALPQDTWRRLDALAVATLGRRVWLTTAWGSTETSPLVTSAHFVSERAGNIGVPVPGCELKLVPSGSKMELRVRGPNVTPGYHRDPDKTAAAFDEAGFYRIGDAGKLVDPDDPAQGVLFDGRVSEDFKLHTGSWVNVGAVRTDVLSAAAGLLTNAVVAGHDRAEVGLLAWLNAAAAQRLAAEVPASSSQDPAMLRKDERVLKALHERLCRYNEQAQGSSRRIGRLLLLAQPPSLDQGEITDKGYVNAAAVLAARADRVEQLFAKEPGPDVMRW